MRQFLERYLDSLLRLMRLDGQLQGTRDFVVGRTKIGASEAGYVNTGTPRSYLNIIRNKVEPSRTRALALLWGNVFEDTHVDVLQLLYGERVHRAPGNLPGPAGTSCSPDGVGVVFDGTRYMLAMYELKCLFSRTIIRNKPMIPNYYAQVQWGLNVLNHAAKRQLFEVGVFSEAVFRVCAFDDFDFTNNYNTSLHDPGEFGGCTPICIGVQYVIALKDCAALLDLYDAPVAGLLDLGADNNFRDLLVLERNVDYRVEVGQIFKSKKKPFLRAAPVGCIGVIHWKLFDLHVRRITPDPGYIEARRPAIDLITRAIIEAREMGVNSVAERLVSVAGGVELQPIGTSEPAFGDDALLDMEL